MADDHVVINVPHWGESSTADDPVVITSEECRRLEELEEILREAWIEYENVAGPAIEEKKKIIEERIKRRMKYEEIIQV